ncbi:MAG: lipid-binding SYLF domain-containing protein [Syntrophobacteraceae bacterium]
MARKIAFAGLIIAFCLCFFVPALQAAGVSEEAKVQAATAVIREIMDIRESAIPPGLLRQAQGIAIFPGLLKGGFLIGARYGSGILLVRNPDQTWSNPLFFQLVGGSFGLQAGAQSSDVILVMRSIPSLDVLINGKLTLGVDAAVAAGPVGRQAEASTDSLGIILSYSRSRGLFAGLSLEEAVMEMDNGSNAAFYNAPGLLPMEILSNPNMPAPAVAAELKRVLGWYSTH